MIENFHPYSIHPYAISSVQYGQKPTLRPWWVKCYGLAEKWFDTKEEAEEYVKDRIADLEREDLYDDDE